jgi:hypothetical protein
MGVGGSILSYGRAKGNWVTLFQFPSISYINPDFRLADYSAWHLLSRCFLAQLIFQPWRWRRNVPPKRGLTLNELHGVISQKMVLFTINVLLVFTLLRLEFNVQFLLSEICHTEYWRSCNISKVTTVAIFMVNIFWEPLEAGLWSRYSKHPTPIPRYSSYM